MPSLSTIKAFNEAFTFSYIPTAIFVGGTSGVGQAMAELLATYTNGRANIIIIGRNRAAADRIIASFPQPPSLEETNGVVVKHEFIQCDVSLMSNVRTAVEEIKKRHNKINMLVCSTGYLATSQVLTSEGVDESLALRSYARAKFIYELQPLLSNARALGEDARAMMILDAAANNKVNLEDLDVNNFSMLGANAATASYNDVFVKVMGERNPDIAFVHIFPGGTDTPGLHRSWLIGLVATLAKPLLRSPQDSASSMLYSLLHPDYSRGGFWLTKNADKLTLGNNINDEVTKKVWEHIVSRAQLQ